MTYPHRIRLRGPWECIPIESSGAVLPMPRRVTMPGRFQDHGLAAFAGRVRYLRTFGYPGQIDEHERIWMTCAGLEGAAEIQLNGEVLAKDHTGPFAFDVTRHMKLHNRLEVTIAADSASGGLCGEVALEIRCSAYLCDMQARRLADGAVLVTGRVTGTCDAALELYGLVDRSHVHYEQIEPRPEGTPFRFVVPPRQTPVQGVRVDLVHVSTVWYTWETSIDP